MKDSHKDTNNEINTSHYAVFGNPISHSKSPQIHTQFAQQTQQDMIYNKQLVALDGFSAAVADFATKNGKGINITVPFKQEAYELATRLSKRARQAGAVNTLIIHATNDIEGDNTDGIGMVRDMLDNLHWHIHDKTILILGAGGAVRGVLGPLFEQLPKKIFIANRTLDKAQNLAQAFSKNGDIEAIEYSQIPNLAFDIIINGSSASLSGVVPPIPTFAITANTACYDMMYGKELTPFLVWAKQQGCVIYADGLGMLVEQAAESFRLWRNVKPDTKSVIAALR